MSDHSLNRQYDVYAAAREEYRQKIDEQAARIAQLEAALRDIKQESRAMSDIVERLRAWEPMVSSGYECPAAGTVMHEAAAIRALKERT